jgi:hypothetical protein
MHGLPAGVLVVHLELQTIEFLPHFLLWKDMDDLLDCDVQQNEGLLCQLFESGWSAHHWLSEELSRSQEAHRHVLQGIFSYVLILSHRISSLWTLRMSTPTLDPRRPRSHHTDLLDHPPPARTLRTVLQTATADPTLAHPSPPTHAQSRSRSSAPPPKRGSHDCPLGLGRVQSLQTSRNTTARSWIYFIPFSLNARLLQTPTHQSAICEHSLPDQEAAAPSQFAMCNKERSLVEYRSLNFAASLFCTVLSAMMCMLSTVLQANISRGLCALPHPGMQSSTWR